MSREYEKIIKSNNEEKHEVEPIKDKQIDGSEITAEDDTTQTTIQVDKS